MQKLFPTFLGGAAAVGLLLVRLVMGAAFILHGWPKIQSPMDWMDKFGMQPAPDLLQAAAAVAEFGGGILLILGLLTPLAAVLLVAQMGAAIFLVHARDPFVAAQGPSFELPLLYLVVAFLFLVVGPGKLSLDYLLFGRRTRQNSVQP